MSLTVSRTPLRITLGGGGSDLAADGLCVAAAINLYTYVVVNRNQSDEYILKYSDKVERVKQLEDIQHPLIHACLVATNAEPGVEIDWLSDIDGGMGLGSSASFIVGTLVALGCSQTQAAEIAIEIDTGWQDQWICALGGVRAITRHLTEQFDDYKCNRLLGNFKLFSTGMKHDTKKVLEKNARPTNDVLVPQAQRVIKLLKDTSDSTKIESLGLCLNDQRLVKFEYAPSEEHLKIQEKYGHLKHWKLIGAGDGGFVMTDDDVLGGIPIAVDGWGSCIIFEDGVF